jgi:hypothetical protein
VQGSHHHPDEESIDRHHRATALSQLTTLGKEDYKAEVARHAARTKEWESITTNRNALASWIEETVYPSYHYLLEDKDPRECHDVLQGQYNPFKIELSKQARKDYLQHIAQANTWDKKVSFWITRWQRLMNDSIKQDIPEATKPMAWIDDLSTALQKLGPKASV